MKKMLNKSVSMILVIAMLFGFVQYSPNIVKASAATSGTCGADGDNLTWMLDSHILTISGTGAMKDYSNSSSLPWNDKYTYALL